MDSNPYSGLEVDSITDFHEYIDLAKENGMKAIAFTEHGCVLHNIAKKQACEKAGIKYIHAEEFYVTEKIDVNENKDEANILTRDNYHCSLFAKNYDGVRELNALSSKSFDRIDGHFYYNPRITLDELINTSDNILVLTACVGGILCRGTSTAQEKFLKFIIDNKDRCWLEIQPHNFKKQILYNQYLYRISKEYNLKLIATNDIHAVDARQLDGRKMMQLSKKIDFHDEDACDLSFKNYQQLVDAFERQGALNKSVYMAAIAETNSFADLIEDYKLDYSNKYPRSNNAKEEFKKRIKDGIKKRGIDKLPNYKTEYIPRIKEEFKTYEHNDAIDFMLLDSDYKKWMLSNGMHYGPSRGSVSGSEIAYLLNCTDVDSVKYKLNFSRFMNPERQSLADIDTDIYADDRYKVREYLFNREDLNCCNIITFNTIKMRGAIKDIGRACGYTPEITQEISNTVYEDENGKECVPDEIRKQYRDIFMYVDLVVGTITSLGRHAAGIVCSPTDITKDFGTLSITSDPRRVSQIDMHEIDSLNYVKIDLLGLNAVGLISKACEFAGIDYLTPDNVNLNDENVIKSIAEDTTLIFQFNSGFASDSLKRTLSDETVRKIKAKNPDASYLDIMSMVSGAIRPAGESYREQLFRGEYKDNGNKVLNDFLEPTLGYCIEENQNVSTIQGVKKIKDIQNGDLVYTACGNSFVTNKTDMGYKETLNISTSVSDIVCTNDHLILTDRGYIEAKNITSNDSIAYRIGCESDATYDKNKLQLIGYLIGDGILSHNNEVGFVNRDIDVINSFTDCVSKFDNCTTRVVNRRSRVNKVDLYYAYVKYVKIKKSKNPVAKYLTSIELKYENGGGKLATEKNIPSFIFGLNKDCLLTFIGAYTDTDCCIKNKNKKQVVYKTSSVQLKNDLIEVIRRIGYVAKYVFDEKTNSYAIYVLNSINFLKELYPYSFKIRKHYLLNELLCDETRNRNSQVPRKTIADILRQHNVSLKKVYKITGVNLYQKHDYINKQSIKKINQYFPNVIPDYLFDNQINFIKVNNINKNGVKHVYDLSINKEHNFLCNGFVVHNCIYQEQVIEFLHKFCGFTMGQADIVRRGFAKKTGTGQYMSIIENGGYMVDIHGNKDDRYIKGFVVTAQEEYGMTENEAREVIKYFLKVIEDASSYLFSKNHSDPYSMIGYFIGWLRYYYPLQLFTAALIIYQDNEEKSINIKNYIKSKGIDIKPAKFGKSKGEYYMDVDQNVIYQGIGAIKYCNYQIGEELYALSSNKYDSFVELLKDIYSKTSIKNDQLEILIKLNYFSDFGNNKYLLGIKDLYDKFGKAIVLKKDKVASLNISEELVRKYCDKETEKQYRGIDNIGLIKELSKTLQNVPLNIREQIGAEKDYLGNCVYTNERIPENYYIVVDYITYKDPCRPYFTCYNIHNGTSHKTRINNNKTYKHNPFGEYSILEINEFTPSFKKKKNVEGKWIVSDEIEEILEKYEVIKND